MQDSEDSYASQPVRIQDAHLQLSNGIVTRGLAQVDRYELTKHRSPVDFNFW